MLHALVFVSLVALSGAVSPLHSAIRAVAVAPCGDVDQEATLGLPLALNIAMLPVQSFTAGQPFSCGAAVYTNATASGSITITLYNGNPSFGGAVLAAGTATNVQPLSRVVVAWPSPVTLMVGTQYFLAITNALGSSSLSYGATLFYPGGHLFTNSGLNPQVNSDIRFETFFTTTIATE